MNIQLLLTGNELMNGDIVDSNSAMVAEYLDRLGVTVSRKVTIGDNFSLLVAQLQELSASCDLLLVNGGLGPTVDDLTAAALAELVQQPLAEHPQAIAHLEQWCQGRGARLNAANRKQAQLPQGAAIIPNPVGSAVGIQVRHNNCDILCTPGVPSELRAMLEQSVVPLLASRIAPDQKRLIQRFHTFGLGESGLQQWIADALPDWPETLELGFRAGAPTLEVKLQCPVAATDLLAEYSQKLRGLIGDYIVAEDRSNLAQSLIDLLRQQGKRVTTAESCTGGLIASMLTEQPGASDVFEAGFVTYADAIKQRVLGVDPATLASQGAVSEAVVREMATGALNVSGADYAVAVSGIAGPTGGSDSKPAGTVCLAWGSKDQLQTATLFFPYGRRLFQTIVAGAGLDLLRRSAAGIAKPPRYLSERRAQSKTPNAP